MVHGGPGEALLVSRGTATGGENGIAAETLGGSAGTMSLDVNDVSGGDFGVSILTREAGGATLITRGLIDGGIAAINAVAGNGGAFSLTNLGTIRNASSASADLAIQTAGGAVDILNNGSLLGTIRLDRGVVAPDPEPEEPHPPLLSALSRASLRAFAQRQTRRGTPDGYAAFAKLGINVGGQLAANSRVAR